MINTLKQIDDKLREFCNKSAIVNEFEGKDFNSFSSKNHSYPLVWATPIKMSNVNGQVGFVFRLSVMDVVHQKTDLIKCLSDLALIIVEILTWLDDDSDNFHYYLVTTSDFEPFSEYVDNVCGWQGELTFRLKEELSVDNIRFK